ncbi:MAG: DUF333 domain-containing protein [Pseudomonadota bacterium]
MNIHIIQVTSFALALMIMNTLYADNYSRANPASVHCKKYGGQLELRQTNNGVQGICHFSDGSQCDEWAFFKRQCQIGKRWVYQCDEGLSFMITYSNNSQHALLAFGDQEINLKQKESGSGIRYNANDITFQGKGLEGNLIMEDGKPYGDNCHVPVANK